MPKGHAKCLRNKPRSATEVPKRLEHAMRSIICGRYLQKTSMMCGEHLCTHCRSSTTPGERPGTSNAERHLLRLPTKLYANCATTAGPGSRSTLKRIGFKKERPYAQKSRPRTCYTLRRSNSSAARLAWAAAGVESTLS